MVITPGLGIVIAGPIAAGFAGAGAGGITGGVIGALVGSVISEERARLYDSGIKSGNIVMGVNPRIVKMPSILKRIGVLTMAKKFTVEFL